MCLSALKACYSTVLNFQKCLKNVGFKMDARLPYNCTRWLDRLKAVHRHAI